MLLPDLAGKCQVHGVDNVGTVPAAVTAYLAVHEFKPDLVISVGTAGGFKSKGAAIGDVFLATAFANHDRRIPIPVRPHLMTGASDVSPSQTFHSQHNHSLCAADP